MKGYSRLAAPLILGLTLLLLQLPLLAQPTLAPAPLSLGEKQAEAVVLRAQKSSAQNRAELSLLRQSLTKLSSCLNGRLQAASQAIRPEQASGEEIGCVKAWRAQNHLPPDFESLATRLESAYRAIPSASRTPGEARGFMRAMAQELYWASQRAQTPRELSNQLRSDLVYVPGLFTTESLKSRILPEDIPLARFKRMNPILVFILKHRLARPPSYASTAATDVVAGKFNVGVGVELEGTVTAWPKPPHLFPFDGDYVFNFGALHLEITPEWRLLHPGFPEPKAGQKIKVWGWTYYDLFHPAGPHQARSTDWEIHPVRKIQIEP